MHTLRRARTDLAGSHLSTHRSSSECSPSHWDGHAWKTSPFIQGGPGASLHVWGSGPSDVWFGGNFLPAEGDTQGLLGHWNGVELSAAIHSEWPGGALSGAEGEIYVTDGARVGQTTLTGALEVYPLRIDPGAYRALRATAPGVVTFVGDHGVVVERRCPE